jgi:hypothetical protein
MRQERKTRYEQNVSELRRLYGPLGLEIWEFSGVHLRIVGKNLVDFWPTTGKAWMVGSRRKGRVMTASEVCDLALGDTEILPDGASEHMRAMQ